MLIAWQQERGEKRSIVDYFNILAGELPVKYFREDVVQRHNIKQELYVTLSECRGKVVVY